MFYSRVGIYFLMGEGVGELLNVNLLFGGPRWGLVWHSERLEWHFHEEGGGYLLLFVGVTLRALTLSS